MIFKGKQVSSDQDIAVVIKMLEGRLKAIDDASAVEKLAVAASLLAAASSITTPRLKKVMVLRLKSILGKIKK